MDISIRNAFLPHDDAEASLGFYRDILGFELRNDVGYNGLRWLTVGPVGQPSVSLVLHPPAVDAGVTEQERQTVREMMAKGTYGIITFSTSDLAATFERLQAAGVDVVQEPIDQPWGVRDCAFRDPAGNLIRMDEVR